MPKPFFESFLARADSRGHIACECGQTHALGTRTILVSGNALAESAGVLEQGRGRGLTLWVLSDGNTEAAAGERWKSGLRAARIVSRVLPGVPRVVPTMELVQDLAREARALAPDLLAGVGSGVISDLVKRVSLDTGIPNWSVATAASVDAYTSATSAIRVGGFHNAIPCTPSQVVVCDLGVIAAAPRRMLLAGLGDLLAKFIAFLDWNLSRMVTGERYCAVMAEAGVGSARAALRAARRAAEDPLGSVRTLTDAALTSGLAMQALGNSRSAASAEHTIAHFWETAGAVGSEEHDLHGILAGAASRLVLAGYERFYRGGGLALPDRASRLGTLAAEKPWRDTLESGLVPYLTKIRQEMGLKHYDRAVLSARLEAFAASKDAIQALALPLLDELAAAVETLGGMGFPFSPRELGIPRDMCMLPSRSVRLLRSRYSTFDLAWELGTEGKIVEAIAEAVGG
jgi:glycerol-1-phosphate dehydrogenase [NAD(P)+]